MKKPESLKALVDYGIIQEIVRPLMSGKEAQVYVVLAGGEACVAKVYKEANQRTFKHRSNYTEGRRTRSTRDKRAMSKRSQHGRKMDEDVWRSTEVEMIYRLRDAGVRVPEVINFVEGVLVMELIKDGAGNAAPRLGDLKYSPSEALEIYQTLIREVVRMLCAGVIHGDLSEFNVLMSDQGPVVIDFPQSVDPTHNANSQKLLLRDVENLHSFLRRFAPDEPVLPYGEEIWSLFQANRLTPDSELTGRYQAPKANADTEEVMALIEDANRENQMRRGGRDEDDLEDLDGSPTAAPRAADPFRKVVDFSGEVQRQPSVRKPERKTRDARRVRRRSKTPDDRVPPSAPTADSAVQSDASATRRRRRRRRRGSGSVRERVAEVLEPAPQSESLTANADRPASPKSRSRRRKRRGRSRGGASAQAKPERAESDSGSSDEAGDRARKNGVGRKAEQAGQRGGAKRPANPRSSSQSTASSGEGAGSGRPSRRRRRRPRKGTSPR